jgi:hypothetical protein
MRLTLEMIDTTNPTGPVTTALVLLEAIATILSFNRPGPITFLDAPLVGRRALVGCAATIVSVLGKPSA